MQVWLANQCCYYLALLLGVESRDVVLESWTWTRVRLESSFLRLGLELETCGLGLAIYGLGLDTSGLETWT